MIRKKAFFFLLLAIPLGSWMPIPEFEYLNYDIFVSDRKIGEMRAMKNTGGNVTVYAVQTNISFRLFEQYDVNYQLSSSYKNNFLTESALKNIVNNNTEDNGYIKWEGNKYKGQSNGKVVTVHEKITQSIARLYFHEPIGISQIFSEKFMTYQTLKAEKKNEYHLLLDDGGKTRYIYRNGVCAEVISSKSFFKIHIKLRP